MKIGLDRTKRSWLNLRLRLGSMWLNKALFRLNNWFLSLYREKDIEIELIGKPAKLYHYVLVLCKSM